MTPETEQQFLDDLDEIKGILKGRADCQGMLTKEEVAEFKGIQMLPRWYLRRKLAALVLRRENKEPAAH